jgi:hypothetical protein
MIALSQSIRLSHFSSRSTQDPPLPTSLVDQPVPLIPALEVPDRSQAAASLYLATSRSRSVIVMVFAR